MADQARGGRSPLGVFLAPFRQGQSLTDLCVACPGKEQERIRGRHEPRHRRHRFGGALLAKGGPRLLPERIETVDQGC
ncbi:MAG: hypothetical protein EHM37_21780 [Deltaproteobacteria bacterium]|nr:MAG: hypothetical protein EHM37_21780 [Deltaproteobacteria bacterium]